MGHSLAYRLPDFDWSAFYRVVVRGVGPTAIEAVQVDLAGYLRIRNGTAAAFPGARVSVVGTDEARQPPPKPFGLLALNPDTALTPLAVAPAAEPLVPPSIAANRGRHPRRRPGRNQFAHVVRKPAQIALVCDSG
jgi:hypothetical protein